MHVLYKNKDRDAPEQIKDRNGEVVLACCRLCGKAETELSGPCLDIDAIVFALRDRAAQHRELGWEIMREGDPALLEKAADVLARWKSIADTRAEAARINHAAYENLLADVNAR